MLYSFAARKICSSCGVDLGVAPGGDYTDAISHGLCRPCSIHFMADVGVSLDDFIESLDAPVVTVTDFNMIGTANSKARKIDILISTQKRGGVVFLEVNYVN